MKILFVHNEYAAFSGEENSVRELMEVLRENGHEVRSFLRSSAGIAGSATKSFKAFFQGMNNPKAAKKLATVLDDFRPDVVQVQNIYPILSSAIFPVIKGKGIPIVMRCPNYRLFCPDGLCMRRNGAVCEKCFGGKEYWCFLHNCEGNPVKSLGYALRNRRSRVSGNILDNVDVFIVQSQFQKEKFVSCGVPEGRIRILPGICPELSAEDVSEDAGSYVTYVGRVSREKGIYEFIEAARRNPAIPFKVAGASDKGFRIPEDVPANIEFLGFMDRKSLNALYRESRLIVVPSKWYEGFPNVITMGMMHSRPVVTTGIGAMPSIITDGVDGKIVSPGDAAGLADAIASLYADEPLCRKYGAEGKKRASRDFSREAVYRTLVGIYNEFMQ